MGALSNLEEVVVSYDFDRVIDRRCSDSVKWCRYDEDVLPLWVADMDFAAPEPVVRALAERVSHGVFGYGGMSDDVCEVVQERLARLYGWQVEPEHITLLPGVVPGFNLACRAVGMPGDAILVEAPGYPPLLRAPENTGRSDLLVPLVDGGGRYEHDFDALERAITDRTSLFLLCNPHNPVGRVFDRAELERLAEICLRHDLVICSDEIHCDIVFDERQHIADCVVGSGGCQSHDHSTGAQQDVQHRGIMLCDRRDVQRGTAKGHAACRGRPGAWGEPAGGSGRLRCLPRGTGVARGAARLPAGQPRLPGWLHRPPYAGHTLQAA